jgi:hypothetical protein
MRKIGIQMLLLFQFLINVVVSIAPSIFICSVKLGLSWWFPEGRYSQTWITVTWLSIVALYVAFVWVHAREKYQGTLFTALHLIGALTIISTILASLSFAIASNFDPTLLANILFYVVLTVMFSPLIVSLAALDLESCWLMIKSMIPFYLFLPTLVAWFGSYSFARLWDLTWGNRPTGMCHTQTHTQTRTVSLALSLSLFHTHLC